MSTVNHARTHTACCSLDDRLSLMIFLSSSGMHSHGKESKANTEMLNQDIWRCIIVVD